MNYIQIIGHTVIRLDVVDSTNNYAAKLLNETNVLNGTVILAKNQVSGRGQQSASWQVESGQNITMSIVLNQLPVKSDEQFLISQWIALSVVNLLDKHNIKSKIKWPNDILIEDTNEKIAGILIENSLRGFEIKNSLIGLGLNVNQKVFEEDLNATSVIKQLGNKVEIENILNDLFDLLNANYILLNNQRNKLQELYFENLLGYNSNLNYKDINGFFKAKINSISPDGRLVLIDDSGEKRTYMFKQVQLIL